MTALQAEELAREIEALAGWLDVEHLRAAQAGSCNLSGDAVRDAGYVLTGCANIVAKIRALHPNGRDEPRAGSAATPKK